jgi:hypothetical protein
MKAHGGVVIYIHVFLTWVVSFMLRPLYSLGKSPRCPLDSRLGGPQNRSGRHGEKTIADLTGTWTPTPGPVAGSIPTKLCRLLGDKSIQKSWGHLGDTRGRCAVTDARGASHISHLSTCSSFNSPPNSFSWLTSLSFRVRFLSSGKRDWMIWGSKLELGQWQSVRSRTCRLEQNDNIRPIKELSTTPWIRIGKWGRAPPFLISALDGCK